MSTPFATCDLCDSHKNDTSGEFRVLPPMFRDFGAVRAFCGPVATVKCFEDNSLVKAMVDSAGEGRVLVVDGAASLRRALLGGNLAAAAARNGWAGLWIHGAVRDLAELRAVPIAIWALGHLPMPCDRKGQGERDVAIWIEGQPIRPGEWLLADADGLLVHPTPLG